MAKKSRDNVKKVAYISVPSQIINSLSSSSLQSLLHSPKKSTASSRNKTAALSSILRSPKLWSLALFVFGFVGLLNLLSLTDPLLLPFSPHHHSPCATTEANQPQIGFPGLNVENGVAKIASGGNSNSSNVRESESEELFWKQPNGMGYRPCLGFSRDYKRGSELMLKERNRYLLVVVSGGMNQQRNQIVDAVVIARILGATLVVPILQVNVIWGDESEFPDIFDLEHFKSVLSDDVRIVSSLPSTHIMTRPVEERRTPLHASPQWIRSRYLKRLKRDGVLLLRGLDSRLSKDLPSDLQKLRCKVAFNALRFAPSIMGVGNKIAERMGSKGPYIALHLRMEKDVWVRTGCLPGLTPEYDEMIANERQRRPELLTARSNMTYQERKLAGLCPLNAIEVARLLKALGAPKSARIFWAGGEPLGGAEALSPITKEFPHFYNKHDLALEGELEAYAKKASVMAAVDFIVAERSQVFMPSHGGNMGHAIQGHRAFAGHKKYITPNKRHMLPYFVDASLPEAEFNRVIGELHSESLGQPELRSSKAGRDVTKYPIPECMCNDGASSHTR